MIEDKNEEKDQYFETGGEKKIGKRMGIEKRNTRSNDSKKKKRKKVSKT